MTQQLYIKTDGPIPEGCDYLTAGKVYELLEPISRVICWSIFVDDKGRQQHVHIPNSDHLGNKPWILCDQHGNPVPAPWEGEKECGCRCCMSCSYEMSPSQWWEHAACPKCASPHDCVRPDKAPTPINYRVHAEALAEALRGISMFSDLWKDSAAHKKARQALAAFDQDKGNK